MIYDAEHWFDAYNHNPDYALQTLQAAAEAGSEWLTLCDTNGGTLPAEIERITKAVCNEIHHFQGYGERCGNANLCSVIPNLQLKLGYACLPDEKLALLTETARAVSEVVNLAPDDHAPFVGLSAFGHKGGMDNSSSRSTL